MKKTAHRVVTLSAILLGGFFLSSTPVALAIFDVDLKYGARGPKVVELQNILIREGYLQSEPSGNFYSLTRQAVIAFQKANGVNGTGYVGPVTRGKLNQLLNTGVLAPVSGGVATSSVPKSISPPVASGGIPAVPFYVSKTIWEFASTTAEFQTLTTKRPPAQNFVDGALIQEKQIIPQSIVLVRCQYKPEFIDPTNKQFVSPLPLTGTGVIVSPEGHIITAAHVLRPDPIKDINGKVIANWKRLSCEVAKTDIALTPIDAFDINGYNGPSRFIPASVVFEPTDEQYNYLRAVDPDSPGIVYDIGGGADLDFALLKIEGTNLPYAPLVNKLVSVKLKEPMIGIGYPGNDATAFALERLDGQFDGFSWSEYSSCMKKEIVEQCGVSYQAKRYKADYKKLYNQPTPLGKHTPYFRGGFSGGPLFYKGNVAGIMVYRKENAYSDLYDFSTVGMWNWVQALASHEIVSTLKSSGITLPTVP